MYQLVIQTDNDFLKDYYTNYKIKHAGDSGIDIVFPDYVSFGQYTLGTLIPLGIKVKLLKLNPITHLTQSTFFDTYLINPPVSYYLYPRSSIYKTPVRLANSVGIIDAGYRGELKAPCDILEKWTIEKGTKLFQICAPDLGPITKITLTDELDETSRGSGGFGSTGA